MSAALYSAANVAHEGPGSEQIGLLSGLGGPLSPCRPEGGSDMFWACFARKLWIMCGFQDVYLRIGRLAAAAAAAAAVAAAHIGWRLSVSHCRLVDRFPIRPGGDFVFGRLRGGSEPEQLMG